MIQQPACLGKFEFAVMASLRASQLMRGCLPKVDGDHTVAVTAQREVAEGKVTLMSVASVALSEHTSPLLPDAGEH